MKGICSKNMNGNLKPSEVPDMRADSNNAIGSLYSVQLWQIGNQISGETEMLRPREGGRGREGEGEREGFILLGVLCERPYAVLTLFVPVDRGCEVRSSLIQRSRLIDR
ncbi:hypothetical protein L3X38_044657 [Prunus dulcis]|uniref:Uncharacterized protein n=1 Tax=Prunus dulcis TaxID=3755 RepID=A0AAD4V0V3_PRUDU|nr:hypothetical protein L3X38_044657 [Prunus dulcis]